MTGTLLVGLGCEACADRVDSWVPDLVRAGFGGVTLLHVVQGTDPSRAAELDSLRPALDKLVVHFSALGMPVDVAFKRGDPARWLTSLTELGRAQLLVLCGPSGLRTGSDSDILRSILEGSRAPVLVLSAAKPPRGGELFARPFALAPPERAAVLYQRCRSDLRCTCTECGPVEEGLGPTLLLVDCRLPEETWKEPLARAPSDRPVLYYPRLALEAAVRAAES
jgi:hypothetical protein